MEERIAEERKLWEAIPNVPDLQCAWQILLQSATQGRTTRSEHCRPQSADYAHRHDEGIWATVRSLLKEVPGSEQELSSAKQVGTLTMRKRGLGLRSASRCARAAYWASWSDALHMIHQRTMAELVVEAVCQEERPGASCLGELQDAAAQLEREGFWWRPSWEALRGGERPPLIDAGEPCEWPHGWQFWASSVSDTFFRNALLSHPKAARQAHLRSHSGRSAGAALAFAPTGAEYTIAPHLFRMLVLERLHLPLSITEALCNGCGDPLGTRTGRVKKRATPTERVLARIFREAGARVRFNAFLET